MAQEAHQQHNAESYDQQREKQSEGERESGRDRYSRGHFGHSETSLETHV